MNQLLIVTFLKMINSKVVWIIFGLATVFLILMVVVVKLSFSTNPITPKNVIEVKKGECSSDTDCPNNSFCDINRPGGMTPNGYESGETYGSQKCIITCKDNSDCSSKLCKNYSIVTGDIIINKLGCAIN